MKKEQNIDCKGQGDSNGLIIMPYNDNGAKRFDVKVNDMTRRLFL